MIEVLHDIIQGVIAREGGYVDHPSDRGGPTMYGITSAVARTSGYHGEIGELPRSTAETIYWDQYIEGPGFARIAPWSPRIAQELVDTGVNMGPGTATTFLQRALNALNAQGHHYRDITVDGGCGPKTRGALRTYLDRRGDQGEIVMLRLLNCLQGTRYLELAEDRESQEDFLFGWVLHRVEIGS